MVRTSNSWTGTAKPCCSKGPRSVIFERRFEAAGLYRFGVGWVERSETQQSSAARWVYERTLRGKDDHGRQDRGAERQAFVTGAGRLSWRNAVAPAVSHHRIFAHARPP